jgi:hypothetical protein
MLLERRSFLLPLVGFFSFDHPRDDKHLPPPPPQQQQQQSVTELILPRLWLEPTVTMENGNTFVNNNISSSSSISSSTDAVADLAMFLCHSTPSNFRRAIQQSGGRFLYRGAEAGCDGDADSSNYVSSTIGTICNPQPDLLLPGTYDDPDALVYFQCLEERLTRTTTARRTTTKLLINDDADNDDDYNKNNGSDRVDVALPSTGHIGTSDSNIAKQWGDTVVSVWPLGNELNYVWPADRQVFYPTTTAFNSDGRICSSITNSHSKDRLVIDTRLDEALRRQNREVLFACRGFHPSHGRSDAADTTSYFSPFLTVPIAYDDELQKHLQKLDYGS